MWEKFKQWLNDRRERKQDEKIKKTLNSEIAINKLLLGGPNYAIYNVHQIPKLICSVYFEQDKEWVVVDFSREKDGIAHFMIFTKDKSSEYGTEETELEAHTFYDNAQVFMKYYEDGSEGWCFRY